jgi:hypothetical protein
MPETERAIPNARHEPTDVGEGFVWGAVAALLALLATVTLVTLWTFPQSLDRTIHLPLPVYPEPRLQPSPTNDMRAFGARELQQLNGVGWVDKARGTVHIPIDDAMRKLAQDGIPGWPAPGFKPPGPKP